MTDRERAIKWLECNLNFAEVAGSFDCEQCGYECRKTMFLSVPVNLLADALALLRAQEPRVMTLEEVLENAGEIGFLCWVEDHIEDIGPAFLFPAVVTSDDTYVEYIGNACYEGAIYHWAYNKRLRCWAGKPTDAQREATPWN